MEFRVVTHDSRKWIVHIEAAMRRIVDGYMRECRLQGEDPTQGLDTPELADAFCDLLLEDPIIGVVAYEVARRIKAQAPEKSLGTCEDE